MKPIHQSHSEDERNQETILIKPRPTQTKVKHLILKRYLNAWGSIIINGLRRQPRPIHLVYIDCNAYAGRYSGDIEAPTVNQSSQPIFGTPIIGIQALDSLADWVKNDPMLQLRTNTILIEKNENVYQELKRSLGMAGLLQRARETRNFSSLKDGEIALLCADSTNVIAELIHYTQAGSKFSLFLLDPYGPKGIPFPFVRTIIQPLRHDVIINMPYQDLHKKSGMAMKSDLMKAESEIISNYDAMFGHDRWQHIVRAIAEKAKGKAIEIALASDSTGDVLDLEVALMECYRKSLRSVDASLSVKSIGLHFPDRERTMFYLYLTTHDSNGALKMNELLWDAQYQEHELRWKLRDIKQRGNQLSLWDLPAPSLQRPPRDTTEAIAERIKTVLHGKTICRRDIYGIFADEAYFASEIDKALRYLRTHDLASFEGTLTNNTRIMIKNR